MRFKDFFKRWGSSDVSVASAPGKSVLPPPEEPKAPAGQQSVQNWKTQIQANASKIPRADRRLASTDVLTFRNRQTTADTLQDLMAASPDLSGSAWAYARVAITEGYLVYAANPDGTINPEGTRAAQEVVQRFNLLPDFSTGFSQIDSLPTLSEALLKDGLQTGAMGLELVLDKARLPYKLSAVAQALVNYIEDGEGLKPVQTVGGTDISLDVPTYFSVLIDQDLRKAYPSSPFEAAIQSVLADAEFTNDLRRVIKRALHPRLNVSIDLEMFKKTIPPEILSDPKKYQEYLQAVRSEIEGIINGLNPEDALVLYSFITVSYVEGGSGDYSAEIQAVQDIVNAKLSTGAKALPSILGHGSGSQNVASSETLLFLKSADMFRRKLNELYSKAFTLAVRLLGHEVVVYFEYGEINLRPDIEVEAFRAQKQARILELLSLGMMSDEEACLRLTGRLPPAGAKPLAGTGFYKGGQVSSQNPYSNTSSGGNGGGLNQAITSDAPEQTRGKAK